MRIKSVGGRRWVIAVCAVFITIALFDIGGQLDDANRLKEEDIKLKKEQLDLARRQFKLDSIAFSQKLKMK